MSGAILSDDGVFRYALWREVGTGERACMFLMLNPSTADATQDDPTIRRCKGFAKAWGYGRLLVGNLFAFRATDPRQLRDLGDRAIGPENDEWLTRMARASELIVAAWGAHAVARDRAAQVAPLGEFVPMRCLGRTKHGGPRHPLYMAKTAGDGKLEAWP